ncbi:integral membrane protein [Biscogniauxia sp. FL1348]|nr:integral membrane protein [Biscogniauxia sp. FL1348]
MNAENEPIGLVPPPPGVIPNFEHPEDTRWWYHLAILIFCCGLVTFFYVVRCYARFTTGPKLMVEDLVHYGEGFHAWEVTHESYREILKWLYASSVVYCPTAFFTKATLLLLISRVFAVKETVVLGIRIFLVALLVCYLPIQGIKMAICIPVRAYWDTSVQDAHCLDQRKVFIADLCLAIITDLVILLVPIPLTWSLNMPLRKKVKIIALLGAGGAATAVTILRMVKVIQFLNSTDVTYDFTLLDLATTIEITIGLICACLPSINILIEKHWGGRLLSSRDPNSPRTVSDTKRKRYNSRFSSWWGSRVTQPTTQSSSPVLSATEGSPRDSVDFDVERQMLSGKPIHMGQLEHSNSSVHGRNLSLINSAEGRREGWLTQEEEDPAGNMANSSLGGHGEIRKTVEISLQLSCATGNEFRLPDKIWDGTLDNAISHESVGPS